MDLKISSLVNTGQKAHAVYFMQQGDKFTEN